LIGAMTLGSLLFPILRMKRVALVPVPETDEPTLAVMALVGPCATALLAPHRGFLPRLVWFLARQMI